MLAQRQLAMPVDGDVAHLWPEVEKSIYQVFHHIFLLCEAVGLLPLDSLRHSQFNNRAGWA